MLGNHIKNLSSKSRILYLVCIFSAILFVGLIPGYHPYPFSHILKIIPLLALFVLVLTEIKGKNKIFIILALIFCMTGDVLLDLDRTANFKMALIAFLIGHLFYIVTFLIKRHFEKNKSIFLILVLAYTLTIGFLLKDISQQFLAPVMIYLSVISIMTLSSFLMKPFSWIVSAGAIIFMFSDTIIAVNKFLMPVPNSMVLSIGLYFTAQILLITGLMICDRTDTAYDQRI